MGMIGVWFGNKHSYDDWHVYLDGFTVDYPSPRRITVSVPLSNGIYDVTNVLTDGKIFYENRKISISFKIIDNPLPWQTLYSMIARDVHGKNLRIIYDMDPFFYWEAYNCTVGSQSQDEDVGSFTIECDCYPFKRETKQTEIGFTLNQTSITQVVDNLREEVVPVIYSSTASTVTFEGNSYSLKSGNNTISGIEFKEGPNTLVFKRGSSNSNIVIKFTRGDL